MAITPNYNWQTPAPTDFVVDLPADFETFADAADATVKGIDDRVADLEVITTQGDLIVGDATGDPSRLALGTTGQVLSSNGTTATWVSPSPGYVPAIISTGVSAWLKPLYANTDTQNVSVSEDVTYFVPVFIPTGTVDRIAIRTGSNTPSGTQAVRLGIYSNSLSNKPDQLILDAGTVAANNNGTNYTITVSQSISSNWYWLAMNHQNTGTGAASFIGQATGASAIFMPFADAQSTGVPNTKGFTETGITGAFSNVTSLTILNGNTPTIWVRIV